MVNPEDARASLAEITDRHRQALDGTTRGRHRGWDTTGLVAVVAGFAALDLPAPLWLRIALLAVATGIALTCFTRAGQHARVALHPSRMTGGFWAVLLAGSLAFGALTVAALRLLDAIDFPLRSTLTGVLLAVLIAVSHPLYRAALLRFGA